MSLSETPVYPDISSILDTSDRRHCQDLFDELASLTITAKVTQERIDEIKQELDHYQDILDAPGIQHNGYVYACQRLAGRRTLDITLLMEHGCPKDVIDSSYREGLPYSRRVFKPVVEKEGG